MDPMRLIATSLLTATLAAQTQAEPANVAATRPHVVIETVGPDGWRSRLGPTNVGGMLSSEEGRAYWQPQMTPILSMWQMLAGDETAFEAASERLFGFGGSIRVAMRFENDRRRGNVTHTALLLQGDGRTDLALMAKDVRQLIERGIPGEWQQAELAGKTVQLRAGGEDVVSAPIVEADRMMLVAGPKDDIQTCMAMAEHLVTRPLVIGKPTPNSPALHVQFDMPALLAATGVFTANDAKLMKALGFDSLDQITITLGAAGPRVSLDVGVSFRNDNRGLFAAFMPKNQGVSPLSQLWPGETSAWKVGRFDFGALFEAVVDAVEESGFASNPGEVRKEINDEFGIDLAEDLFAHMTDEVLVIGSPLQSFDRASEATWLFAFRLRDVARFDRGMRAMLKQAKPFLSPAETVKVGDVELRRYGNMLRYDLWMATGNGLFVVAGGRDAEEQATTMLQKAAVTELTPVTGQETWFQGLGRYLPPGHNGLAQVDLDSLAGVPTEWWFELLEEVLPLLPSGSTLSAEEAELAQERFRKLLREHSLTVVRTATGYADSRFHWRMFW